MLYRESPRESPIACLLSFLSYVVCLIAKLISLDSAHGKCAVLWLVSMVTESVKGVRWFFVCKLQPLPVANLIGSFLFWVFYCMYIVWRCGCAVRGGVLCVGVCCVWVWGGVSVLGVVRKVMEKREQGVSSLCLAVIHTIPCSRL